MAEIVKESPSAPNTSTTLGRRPLYSQVEDLMISYMISGVWQPGKMLPSETVLASDFGVSQGTVRKALNELESQNLVFRRQGRGTFITEHTPQDSLFHFFHISDDRGRSELPTSVVVEQKTKRPTKKQARLLNLDSRAMLESILRIRYLRGKPIILERIYLPTSMMSGLSLPVGEEMTQELYVLYQKQFRITVVRAHEELKAVRADSTDARYLGVNEVSPILQVHRVAYGLRDTPVELRISRCNSERHHYSVDID